MSSTTGYRSSSSPSQSFAAEPSFRDAAWAAPARVVGAADHPKVDGPPEDLGPLHSLPGRRLDSVVDLLRTSVEWSPSANERVPSDAEPPLSKKRRLNAERLPSGAATLASKADFSNKRPSAGQATLSPAGISGKNW